MKSLLRRWFGSDNNRSGSPNGLVPAPIAELAGQSFDIATTAKRHEDLPHPEWRKVHAWVNEFDEGDRVMDRFGIRRAVC